MLYRRCYQHRIPITHLELFQTKMNKFSPLKHTLDGFWELDPSQTWEKPLDTPMVIRMTAANGEVLQDVIDAIRKFTVKRKIQHWTKLTYMFVWFTITIFLNGFR